jgi:hypothetical protein
MCMPHLLIRSALLLPWTSRSHNSADAGAETLAVICRNRLELLPFPDLSEETPGGMIPTATRLPYPHGPQHGRHLLEPTYTSWSFHTAASQINRGLRSPHRPGGDGSCHRAGQETWKHLELWWQHRSRLCQAGQWVLEKELPGCADCCS